ncbi:MAG: RelA/SpoT family protein [Leptospirales bacterium]
MLIKGFQKGNIDILLQKVAYIPRTGRNLIKKAYLLAEDAHKFQKRLSGEPYIIHPLSVSLFLADLGLDYESICAGLLHDVLEDTPISDELIEKEFGGKIFDLVKAVTKISVLKKQSRETQAANNIRQMILASFEDPRVLLIKLADKIHNMRTLQYQPEEKAITIAQEAFDIYAPLAGRLGIFKVKWELEDICMSYLHKKDYYELKNLVASKKSDRQLRIKAITSILQTKLKQAKINATVEGRSKHFYSIYQKMKVKNSSFEKIMDLNGIRVLVNTVQECYSALGVIHTLWSPIPRRFKDYISVPKSNGYQSLHTSVIGKNGKPIEAQIRTHQMHRVSEFGIAAHWSYKSEDPVEVSKQFALLQNIAFLEESGKKATEFVQELKESLSDGEIYVFTPKGDITTLPKGSTVLDFAFRIHTELGLFCAGAKIDSRLVSYRTQLVSGNQVEVISSPTVTPSRNWLKILKTSQARSKLKTWLKKQDPAIKAPAPTALHSVETEEGRTLDEYVRIIPDENSDNENAQKKIAECCSPTPGFSIIGVWTKNNTLSIHKQECPAIRNSTVSKEISKERVEVEWINMFRTFRTKITLGGIDRPQIALDIIRAISFSGAHIISGDMKLLQKGLMHSEYQIELDSVGQFNTILESLKDIDGIREVKTESTEAEVV